MNSYKETTPSDTKLQSVNYDDHHLHPTNLIPAVASLDLKSLASDEDDDDYLDWWDTKGFEDFPRPKTYDVDELPRSKLTVSREVFENGHLVYKPANVWSIKLKVAPPKGSDVQAYHQAFLDEVLRCGGVSCQSAINDDTMFAATLLPEEIEKFKGMDAVSSVEQLL